MWGHCDWARGFQICEEVSWLRNVSNPLHTLQNNWYSFKMCFLVTTRFLISPRWTWSCGDHNLLWGNAQLLFGRWRNVLFVFVCFFQADNVEPFRRFVAHFLTFWLNSPFWNKLTVVFKLNLIRFVRYQAVLDPRANTLLTLVIASRLCCRFAPSWDSL